MVRFAEAVRPTAGVLALYCGGSLATDDFEPGVSDLDLVAVVPAELDDAARRDLSAFHASFRRREPSAERLHCVYVPRDGAVDVAARHVTWAHGELFRRPLSGIARAELLRGGITVFGPAPGELLPAVDDAVLERAARGELIGYWRSAVRWPWLWVEDRYVDLGLLTLARVEATLTEGRLITKSEAITRLGRFGVPGPLVEEIADRRRGRIVPLTTVQRIRRAVVVRRIMTRGIRSLT